MLQYMVGDGTTPTICREFVQNNELGDSYQQVSQFYWLVPDSCGDNGFVLGFYCS